jgi:RHS repeat-associated protein
MKNMKRNQISLFLALLLICVCPGITLAAGEIVYRAQYTAFGELLSESGTLAGAVDYTYTGQERDVSLAMLDYGARFYNPRLGRFSSLDPIDQPGESPYAYVNNHPLRYVDPTGCTGAESTAALNIVTFVQNLGETAQSALRGWAQVHFANVPQLNMQPNSRDIQNYHLVAAVGLFTAAALTAVEVGVKASDPTGTFSGSMTTTGKAKAGVSTPYGDAALKMGPDGVSAEGSIKGKVGRFENSVDSEGNSTLGAKLGKNSSVELGLTKDGKPSAEIQVGKTKINAGEGSYSLVIQGNGLEVNKSGRAKISIDAGGVGVSAGVDPQRTKDYVNGALGHMNQAMQMNQGGPSAPAKK